MDDAQRWDLIHQKNYKEDEWHSHFAEEKEKLFPRGGLVVELGAGTGADAIYFLKQGHRVVALDISNFALKALHERAKKHDFLQKLVTRQVDFGLHAIPVKDESADVAYSRISLNYFGYKQTTKIFRDIFRILAPGGSAYLSFKSPDDSNEMEYLERSATVYEPNVYIEGGMLRSRFTVEQLGAMLNDAGILNFEVKPLKEDLSKKGEGHHSYLYVNEVFFNKPAT